MLPPRTRSMMQGPTWLQESRWRRVASSCSLKITENAGDYWGDLPLRFAKQIRQNRYRPAHAIERIKNQRAVPGNLATIPRCDIQRVCRNRFESRFSPAGATRGLAQRYSENPALLLSLQFRP